MPMQFDDWAISWTATNQIAINFIQERSTPAWQEAVNIIALHRMTRQNNGWSAMNIGIGAEHACVCSHLNIVILIVTFKIGGGCVNTDQGEWPMRNGLRQQTLSHGPRAELKSTNPP